MTSLKNKVVIITGASSGIGKSAAVKFARAGASVVLAARRIEKLNDLQKQISVFNPNCLAVQTDVTSSDQVRKLFEQSLEKFGRLDILINNAGSGLKAELTDIEFEKWKSVIDTNLTSVFLCTKAAVITMKKQNTPGHVITVCSIAGKFGMPSYSAYCSAKHAVAGLLKCLKWELRKYKIKISAVYPARIDTEFFNSYAKRPSKRQMLSPDDVADCLLAIAQRASLKLCLLRIRNFLKRIKNLILP